MDSKSHFFFWCGSLFFMAKKSSSLWHWCRKGWLFSGRYPIGAGGPTSCLPSSTDGVSELIICRSLLPKWLVGLFPASLVFVLLWGLSHLGSFSCPLAPGSSLAGFFWIFLVVSGLEAAFLFLVVLIFWYGGVPSLTLVAILSMASRLSLPSILRTAAVSPVLRLVFSLGPCPKWPLCATTSTLCSAFVVPLSGGCYLAVGFFLASSGILESSDIRQSSISCFFLQIVDVVFGW